MIEVGTLEPQADFDADELILLLAEQHDLCVRFSALAEGQRTTIVNNQPQRLLEVLADRQRLLDRFVELTGRLGPYQKQWRKMRSKLSMAKSREIDRLIRRVSNNLADVLSNDQKDVKLLSTRNNAAVGAAFQLRNNQQAGMAYAAGSDGIWSKKEWTDE